MLLEANHGGGYQYRLAPADGPLNEETFRTLFLCLQMIVLAISTINPFCLYLCFHLYIGRKIAVGICWTANISVGKQCFGKIVDII